MSRFKKTWPANITIAADPANGMGCLYLPLLKALGASLTAINDALDCTFPAHEANPIKPENIAPCEKLVAKTGAALGVAFDGDADRVAFVDEKGNAVASDLVTAILARAFARREKNVAILYDLRSSRAVPEIIREAGARPVRERVGHSFMKATMRANACIFGGELSGHYYYRDSFYSDSSLITVIELLNVIGETGKTLGTLVSEVKRYAQSGERNFIVEDKDGAMKRLAGHYQGAKVDWLDGVTVEYDDWWFNVRPSNTEPLLRLNLEARDEAALKARTAEVVALIGGHAE